MPGPTVGVVDQQAGHGLVRLSSLGGRRRAVDRGAQARGGGTGRPPGRSRGRRPRPDASPRGAPGRSRPAGPPGPRCRRRRPAAAPAASAREARPGCSRRPRTGDRSAAAASPPTAARHWASRTRHAPARPGPGGCRPPATGSLDGRSRAGASTGCPGGRRCFVARAAPARDDGSGTSGRGGTAPRALASSTIGSSSARRTTNASASSEAESTHCASSTTRSSGASAATADNSDSRATPTRRGVGSSSPDSRPERRVQRRALRLGELVAAVEHAVHQLVQPGEGELGLAASTARLQHRPAALPGLSRQRVQQPALAQPGVADDDQAVAGRPVRARAAPAGAPARPRAPPGAGAARRLSLLTAPLTHPSFEVPGPCPGGSGPGRHRSPSVSQICAPSEHVSQLRSRGNPQLGERPVEVRADGAVRQEEPLPDLAVRQALRPPSGRSAAPARSGLSASPSSRRTRRAPVARSSPRAWSAQAVAPRRSKATSASSSGSRDSDTRSSRRRHTPRARLIRARSKARSAGHSSSARSKAESIPSPRLPIARAYAVAPSQGRASIRDWVRSCTAVSTVRRGRCAAAVQCCLGQVADRDQPDPGRRPGLGPDELAQLSPGLVVPVSAEGLDASAQLHHVEQAGHAPSRCRYARCRASSARAASRVALHGGDDPGGRLASRDRLGLPGGLGERQVARPRPRPPRGQLPTAIAREHGPAEQLGLVALGAARGGGWWRSDGHGDLPLSAALPP